MWERVALSADALPPDSIERIILLSPSIASDYDLRPSLRSAREGIDVFCSRLDIWQLGLGVALVGTADGCHGCDAAGRIGFQPQLQCPEDATLYAKLRQHPWDPAVAWTGNLGGHYGSNRAEFERAYVLPLLVRGSTSAYRAAPPALRLGPPSAVAPAPAMPYHGPGP